MVMKLRFERHPRARRLAAWMSELRSGGVWPGDVKVTMSV